MRVRVLAFLGLAICMSASSAFAQAYAFRNTDRSAIEMCDAKYMPQGMRTWTQAGVARLLPELMGASKAKVHLFFVETLDADKLTEEERQIVAAMTPDERKSLDTGRTAARAVLAWYIFTPQGTRKDQALTEPPLDFIRDLSQATAVDNLRSTVLPCGTVLYGMSNGTRRIDDSVAANVEFEPIALGWYQKGQPPVDGIPGAHVWAANVTTTSTDGVPLAVTIYIFEYCGNITYVLDRLKLTETVVGTAPRAEPAPFVPPAPKLVMPKVVPFVPPVRVVETTPEEHHGWFCSGKKAFLCAALIGGVTCAFVCRPGESGPGNVYGPAQPVKTGGPGGAPGGP